MNLKKGQRIALSAILCVFVALCAVLALVFGTPKTYVPAEEKDNVTVTHTDHTGWTKVTTSDGTLSAGNYYLENDIWRGPYGITVTGDATLCLNGHSLACGSSDSTYSFSVITVTNGATLTICDCDSTTQHTVGDKTYSGGVITGGRCREYGGGVYVENGTLILDGGTIAGNTANYGGGVYVSGKGSFIMNGGMIAGNTAATTSTFAYGGGVYVNGGTFTMNGGTISGNTAQYEGANMYVNAGTVNITGGYFNGGISNGGTIRVSGGYFSESAYNFLKNDFTDSMIVMDISKLGGSAFDDDYVEGYPYAAYRNAVVNNEKSIFYDGSPIKEGEDFFVEGVDGVTLTYQYKTSGGEYVDGLPADIGHYTIKVTGQDIPNKIYCDVEFTLSIYEKVVASVTFNGDTVSCGSMTDAFENASRPDTSADNRAVITLWNNVDMGSAITVTGGQYIALDLNGCKITVTLAGNTPFNVNGGDLVLKDSNAETQYLYYKDSNGKYVFDNGTDEWDTAYGDASAENKGVVNGGVITGGNVSGNAGAFNVYGGGKFTMNGGTIAGNAASYGGGVYLSSNSSFTMNGGTISGNTANNGGGVCSRYTGSSFIMNGGTIADNTASSGSCVYVGENSSFKMTDGYLDGSFYKGSSVTFSGGYFTESTYNSLNNDFRDDIIVIDISKLGGSAFDSDYVEGYPYALYKNVVVTIETNLFYDGAPIKEGEDFFVEGADGVALTYQYKTSGGDYINGLPTDVGIYTIKVTGQDIPNKIYCEKEFVISIHGEALLTVTFDGVTYDCVTVSYAFDLAKGFATTAENRAVIILWADVECDSTHKVESGQYITLDLNGYMFTKTNSGALLDIVGDFILMDSNPVTEHRYYADSNRKYVLDNGTESWQSAYNSASTKGTLYGGVVTGGNNGSGNGGFNVYGGGKFTMKSGVIAGNYASNGGGVYVGSDSSFIMEGGMITGNRAYSYNGGRGGGVCVRYSGGSFTMIGGSIISNTSKNGNGVYVSDKAEVIMEGGYFGGDIENNGGTVSISGGYLGEALSYIASGYSRHDISSLGTSFDADYVEGFPYAVYKNGTVSITANGNSVYDDFPVEEGVDFTVSGAEGVTLTYSYKTSGGSNTISGLPVEIGSYTISAQGFDAENKIWYETTFELTISEAEASVAYGGKVTGFASFSEAFAYANTLTTSADNRALITFFVDLELDDALTIQGGRYITLDLDGNTLAKAGGGSVLAVEGDLLLTDSSITDGVISGDVVVNGALLMKGGTVTGGVSVNGSFTMEGGYLGGGIENNGGTISIEGGYFSEEPAEYIADNHGVYDISAFGTEFDADYLEDFPYAVYQIGTVTMKADSDILCNGYSVQEGVDFTVSGAIGAVFGYSYKTDGGEYTNGLPREVGTYTIKAIGLGLVDGQKTRYETTFDLTISEAEATVAYGGTVIGFATVSNAFDYANSCSTAAGDRALIRLMQDVEGPVALEIASGAYVTLDFSGYKFGGVVTVNGDLLVLGGYFNGSIAAGSGVVSIEGGYFSEEPLNIAQGYSVQEISALGASFDADYLEGFPYAVYQNGTVTITPAREIVYDASPIEAGIDFVIEDVTDVTFVYSYKADGDIDYVLGLPEDTGAYTIKAISLGLVDGQKIWYETEFSLTIHNRNLSVVFDGITKYFASVAEAFNYAGGLTTSEDDRAVITFWNNVDMDSAITVTGGQYIALDLNGCKITVTLAGNTPFNVNGGGLVLKDSNAETQYLYYKDSNGKYVFDNGTDEWDTAYGDASAENKGVVNGGVITGGNASGNGGAFNVYGGGKFTMNGGTIAGNAASYGGGVYLSSNSSFTMNGGMIAGNTASYGGGVGLRYENHSFTMNGGTISGNKASSNGGGVYASDGTNTISGGTIAGNTANYGGGVYVTGGTNTISGSTISGNTAGSGGGVYLSSYSTLALEGGTISGNTASNKGGGVFVYMHATFTMKDGTISDNEADRYGGGVYVDNDSAFTMEGGEVSDNTAIWGKGVHADFLCTFTMAGGSMNGEVSLSSGSEAYITGGYYLSGRITVDYNHGYLYISGGYFSGAIAMSADEVSITGGYFADQDSNEGFLDDGYGFYDISSLGTDFDGDYVDGYPYAVYQIGTVTITPNASIFYDGSPVAEGEDFIVSGADDVEFNYSYKTGDGEYIDGLPTEIGVYTIKADCLKTEDGKKIWYETTFDLTISDAAVTVTFDGEVTGYLSLGEAFAYANGLDTASDNCAVIDLVRDVEVDSVITISSGKHLTLDLNGYAITMTGNVSLLSVEGELLLTDSKTSGTVMGSASVYGSFTMEGGYFGGDIENNGGTVSISGGYFSEEPLNIALGYSAQDISSLGTAFDADYREGFPYAVYKNGTVSITANGNSVYDDFPVEEGVDFTVSGADGVTLSYSYKTGDGIDYVEGLPADAGIYTVKAIGFDSTQKIWYETEFTLTLQKATAAAPEAPTVTGTLTYGEALAGLTLSGGWTWVNGDTVPTASDSGATGYEVTIAVDDQNYDWSGVTGYANGYYTTTVTVTVNAKEITVSITPNGGVYGSVTGASAVLNGLVGTDDPVITLTYTGEGYDSTAVPTDAGTYTVTATIADNNYNLIGTTAAEFTIEKATIARPTENTASFTYKGSELTYVPEGYDEATMSIAGNKQTNANESGYTVTVTLKDTTNYQWTDGGDDAVTFTWVVKKAEPNYTVPTGLSATYGDTLASVTLSDGWTWDDDSQSVGNAGERTFMATFTPDDTANYQTVGLELTVMVAKATPSVTVTAQADGTLYTSGSLYDVAISANAGGVAGSVAWDAGQILLAGSNLYSWTFTPDDTANYEIVVGSTELTAEAVTEIGITVGSQPTKTEYTALETFVSDGMEIELNFNDGSSQAISGYTLSIDGQSDLVLNYAAGGKVTVKVSYGGFETTIELTVTQIIVAVPVAAEDLVYDGFEQVGVAAGAHYSVVGGTAINAGDHQATLTLESENYAWSDASFDGTIAWSIAKATVQVPEVSDKIYTGEKLSSELTETKDYIIVSDDGGIENGQYSVVLELKDSANCMWSSSDESTVTITYNIVCAQNVWETEVSIDGWTYGENENAPVFAAKFGNDTAIAEYKAAGADDSAYVTEVPTAAGIYVLRVTIAGTGNYTELVDTYEFTIEKATAIAPAAPTVTGTLTYGEALAGLTLSGDWTWVNGETVPAVSDSVVTGYEVAIAVDDQNYDWSGVTGYANGCYTTTVTVTVNAKEITVSITPNGGVYGSVTGASAVLNGLVGTDDPVITLTYTGEGYDSTAVPTDAGAYTVTATIADENYNLIGTTAAEFAIEKATIARPTENTDSFTYTGSELTYVPEGYDEATMSIAGNKQTNANESGYTVTITLKDAANYQWTDGGDDAVTFTWIVKKAIVTVPEAAEELIYNGIEQIGVAAGEHYSVVGGSAINAGEYEATLTLESDNYVWSDASFDGTIAWSIAKAEPNVSLPTDLTVCVDHILADVKLAEGWTWADDSVSVGGAGVYSFAAIFTPDDTDNYLIVTAELTVTVNEHTGGMASCTHRAVCEVCGTEYGGFVSHVYNRQVVTDRYLATAATCTAPATYYYSCGCGAKGTATFVYGEALGHTAGEAVRENEIAATCTEDGSYDEVIYCTVCGEELSRNAVIVDALGHTAGEAVRENEIAATCTEDGSYNEVIYCAVCGEELSRNTVIVEAFGHLDEDKDGSCDSCGGAMSELQVTITISGGTIEGMQDSSILIDKDTQITVIADVAEEGKEFKGWSIDGGKTIVSEDAIYTFIADESIALTAVYEDVASEGLSTGAIVGITLGSIAGLLLLAYVIGAVLYKKEILLGEFFAKIYPFIEK